MRQADAYYTSVLEYGDTGSITWMPTPSATSHGPAPMVSNTILACVDLVEQRLAVRDDTVLCVSHWASACTSSSAAPSSCDEFAPHHLPGALFRISHANTGITIFECRENHVIDGVDFNGWALKTWNDQGHL